MAKKNFKQLAVDHVEKAVFGIVLIVVVVGLISTNWSRYAGKPYEITQKVNQGRSTLMTNRWPQDEEEKYRLTAEDAPANIINDRLFAKVDPTPIEMSGKLTADILGGNEPVREPERVAPQEPIAMAGRVFLQLADTLPTDVEETETAPMEDPDENIGDEFRQRDPALTAGMSGEMGGLMQDPTLLGYGAWETELASQYGFGMSGEIDPLTGEPISGAPVTPTLNGRGYHFISVRAVFPLREQIAKYADAIHSSFHDAAAAFDIRDFELERQKAQPGPDPWANATWEKVDLQVATDVLEKSAGFEADVVDSIITNSVITMPLPMRISGVWRTLATHPKIAKYELNDDQIALEVEMTRRLLQTAVEQNKMMEENTIKRGGFARMQFDNRQLQTDLFGGSMYDMGGGGMAGMWQQAASSGQLPPGADPRAMARNKKLSQNAMMTMDQLVADLAKGTKNDKEKKEQEKRIKEWITARMSAQGDLLLFRYLDFGVEPGQTYRYRVRLELANPNFGKRIADAGGLQDVVDGETRFTPWSEITKPTTVADDVKFFVKDVKELPNKSVPVVHYDVFQWDPAFGTTVNSAFDVRLGQTIDHATKTTVIDPAKFSYETSQDYHFRSDEYLIDALEDVKLDDAFHKAGEHGHALKFAPGTRGQMLLPGHSLVNDKGSMLVQNPIKQKADYDRQKSQQALLVKQFESLKMQKEQMASGGGLEGFDPSMLGEDMMGMLKGNQKLRSQLRKMAKPGAAVGRRPPGGGLMP